MKRSDSWKRLFGSGDEAHAAVLSVLRHRYVREKQHAMRYGQHAARTDDPQVREALISMAREEEKHAESIGAKILGLGERLPDVIPIHVAKEQNIWLYLRTDLEEEERCADEMIDDLPSLRGKFPGIAALLERIDDDGKRHRAQLRDMLVRSDPQSAGSV
jgi:rubrerythrin